ncbi:TetR/AcrR family transcriptional regulator [Roseobacteraceae bacterium S113]
MSQTPKPKRGRPKTLNAEKVLTEAMNAYWTRDPADVSINTICGLAAASKPAIYREFGNEDGLMLATLNHYVDEVLSDIFQLLTHDVPLRETLNKLTEFASTDPKMATGCVFYKMRAGKHRLGPRTLGRINEVEADAVESFASFLDECRASGEWRSDLPSRSMARYLVEQIGLAFTLRAAGAGPDQVRQTMAIALSVF